MTTKNKILIVEDESVTALDIKTTLTANGYRVTKIVDSYESALKAIRKEMPDLIIIDIHLTGKKSGIDIASDINRHWKIPYMFVTANYDHFTLTLAKEQYPASFITKPFRSHDLLIAVEMILFKFYKKDKKEKGMAGMDNCRFENNILFVPDHQSYKKVDTQEIIFIKGEGSYSVIQLNSNKVTVRAIFRKFEFLTEERNFVKIHRSYIINIKYIEKIFRKYLVMSKGYEIPFSGRIKEQIMHCLPKLP